MTDEPVIHEGEHILTPAMLKMFGDSLAYAKARYGADYDRMRPYNEGGLAGLRNKEQPDKD